MGWIGKVGHGVHAGFGQKLPNTQHGVGRGAGEAPIMTWANMLKDPSKKFTEVDTVSHNTTSWYVDTDMFLEHT